MRVTFLGTGTSHGIPVIACSCPVCTSPDARNKRYRTSLLVEDGMTSIVIDTGYEFRLAALRSGVKDVDGVLYTHSHADHIMGLDDLRIFTSKHDLPIYGNKDTIERIKTVFDYAFNAHDWSHLNASDAKREVANQLKKHNYGIPLLIPNIIEAYEEFSVGTIRIKAIPAMHGMMEVFGYRIGGFAYVTDVSYISDEALDEIKGVDVLVIGALREREHPTHYNFREAQGIAEAVGCRICYFTHINHETSYEEINRRYSPLCLSSYDNLTLEV